MPVVDILRGTGISVWVDEAKIDAATLWSEEIVDTKQLQSHGGDALTELHQFRQCRQGGRFRWWTLPTQRYPVA